MMHQLTYNTRDEPSVNARQASLVYPRKEMRLRGFTATWSGGSEVEMTFARIQRMLPINKTKMDPFSALIKRAPSASLNQHAVF